MVQYNGLAYTGGNEEVSPMKVINFVINFIALILVLIGAINWGLWGVFQFDFVAWLFGGETAWLSRIVYTIVGLAGIWGLSFLAKYKAIYSCKAFSMKEGEKK
jgi:uncharacterized membrane protein YuzA (DUF378 family)